MVRLVLFDIDGTLIHSGGAGIKAFARAFADEFSVPDGTERLKFGGRTDVSLVRELFALHQVEASPKNFERFFAAYLFWLEKLLKDCQGNPCPGVFEFIEALQALPEPPLVGLLTGNLRRGAEIKLRHFNLWHKFSFGAFADDSEDRDQIAAMAHRRGSERLNRALHGQEVVVVGDTHLDIRCARAIGAKVLAVATGNIPAAELAQHQPDWLFQDLTSVSANDICR